MTLYCGIDLHSNNSVLSIIDEQDKVVFEKRLPNDLTEILEVVEGRGILDTHPSGTAGILLEGDAAKRSWGVDLWKSGLDSAESSA